MATSDRPALLVALGNPGVQYARTRHNMAWLAAEALLGPDAQNGWQQKFKASWRRVTIAGSQVVLLEPQTMMNASGESVQAAARFFRFGPDDIAVLHDDVELGFGEMGIRFGGGLAGHNGLRSVSRQLGTNDFWRIRLGIGRPAHGELHGHVLGRFSADEEGELADLLHDAATLLNDAYRDGFAKAPLKVRR